MSIFDASSTSPGTEEGKMGKFNEDMSRTLDELRRTAGNQTGQGGRLTAAGLHALTQVADIQKNVGLGIMEQANKRAINTENVAGHLKGAEISSAPALMETTEKWKPIPGTGNLLNSSMPTNSAKNFGIGNVGDTTTISNVEKPASSLSKDILNSLKIPGVGF